MKEKIKRQVSTGEKIAYGGGDLASNLILVLTSTFVAFFYTDALGLNAAIIGTIVLVSRFLDGFTDIAIGYIMDKTKSKHGKARPWILWCSVPIAIATILVFAVPNLGEVGKYIYVAITYNLVTTFLYTMINIPYGALTARMSRDKNERELINIFRMFMAQAGALMINAGTLPLVQSLGGTSNQSSWVKASIIYAIIALVLFLVTFFKTKERVNIEEKKKINFKEGLKVISKNNYWLLLVLIWVVMVLGLSMNMTVGTYYAKYVLGNEAYNGYFMALAILPVLIIMPMLVPIIKKHGKRNVALVGSLVSLAAYALILVNPESPEWLMAMSVLRGVGSSTLMATMFAMVADTIEYGHWKTGIRVEGMLYSTTTFGAKVGMGIGSAIALGVLGKVGYDGLAAVQTASAMTAIKVFYLYVPIAFYILLPIIYSFYKLDKKYDKVMADLAEGKFKE